MLTSVRNKVGRTINDYSEDSKHSVLWRIDLRLDRAVRETDYGNVQPSVVKELGVLVQQIIKDLC